MGDSIYHVWCCTLKNYTGEWHDVAYMSSWPKGKKWCPLHLSCKMNWTSGDDSGQQTKCIQRSSGVSVWFWIDTWVESRCWRNCIGCQWSSASATSWPYWRSRYGIRQHRRISVGTSEHAAALGHCDYPPFCFWMCRSDALTLANDPSAALCLQLGTLCLLLSSTVTLSLYLNLG